MPMRRRSVASASALRVAISWPNREISPRVGRCARNRRRRSEVLPAPEGPVRNWNECGSTLKVRSRRTSAPRPYRNPTCSNRTTCSPQGKSADPTCALLRHDPGRPPGRQAPLPRVGPYTRHGQMVAGGDRGSPEGPSRALRSTAWRYGFLFVNGRSLRSNPSLIWPRFADADRLSELRNQLSDRVIGARRCRTPGPLRALPLRLVCPRPRGPGLDL